MSQPPITADSKAAESNRSALTAAAVRDLIVVSAAWDILRVLLLVPISDRPLPASVFIVVKALLVEGIPFFLLRAGRVTAAAWTLSISALTLASVFVVLSGGLRSSGLALLIAILSAATVLFGKRKAVGLASAVAIFFGLLSVMEAQGWPFEVVFRDPLGVVITNVLAAVTFALIPGIRALNRIAAEREQLEHTQQALRESDYRSRELSEASPVGIFRTNSAGDCIYANPRLLEIWALDWDQFQGTGFLARVHPEDRQRVVHEHRTAHDEARACAVEYRVSRPDGIRWVSVRSRPVRNASGDYDGEVGTIVDTTESVQMNTLLREKESYMRAILDSEPECVKTVGADGRLVEMNAAGLAMIEADSEQQVVGGVVSNLIDPEQRSEYQDLHARVLAGESGRMEFRITGLKGTRRWMEMHAAPLRNAAGEIVASVAVSRDISDRKAREESQRKLSLVQATVQIGVWDLDLKDSQTWANAEQLRMFGFPEHCTPEKSDYRQRIHPDDWPEVDNILDAALAGTGDFDVEFRVVWPDSSIHWLACRAEVIRAHDGTPLRVVGVNQDITARRQREEALRESEENFRALFDHAPYGMMVMDPKEFSLVGFNEMAHKQLGYTREEFSKLTLWDFEASLSNAEVRALGRRAQANLPVEFETKHRTKGGEIRDVYITTAPLRMSGRALIYSAVQDITERKRVVRDLLVSEARQRILAEMSSDFWARKDDALAALTISVQRLGGGFADFGYVRLLSPDGEFLEPAVASFGLSPDASSARAVMDSRLSMSETYSPQKVMRQGRGIVIPVFDPLSSASLVPPLFRRLSVEMGIHSMISVPLRSDNKAVGVLLACRHRRHLPPFNEQDLSFTQELADRAAITLAATKLTIDLQAELAQRRAMEAELESMLARLQQLTDHLEKAREEERTRIAREIHDELGQQLTGLKMRFDFLFRAHLTPLELEDQKQTFSRELETAIRAVRTIATGLRPGVLDSLGPEAALEWLARDFEEKFGISCVAQVQSLPSNDAIGTTVFRVAQEALTNVAKHSAASKAWLNCSLQEDAILLEVVDNGVGIQEPNFSKPNAFGLIGMRERAGLAGGSLLVTQRETGGTRLLLSLPVENSRE